LFLEEVNWYTSQKKAKQTKSKDFAKRMKSCDNVEMFDKLLENVTEENNKGI